MVPAILVDHPSRCVYGGGVDDVDEPFELEIEDSIDLHTFAPRDVQSVVEEYLRAARQAGLLSVRVIHGRGTGTQRARVLALLRELSFVTSAHEAPADRGGWGATVVELKPAGSDVEET
jgi:DNA-nicking Smr family endonuclease